MAMARVSGFTIIKNAIINDYPIVEAITSILPVVDEMIVLVGDCRDETRAMIEAIGDSKIKIFDSVWDPSLRAGGRVLAVETDKALAHVDKNSDWAFYIQADEVVHEKYHAAIREACNSYKEDTQVEGLLFKYRHFYGTYDYVGDSRKWYAREIRIVRNTGKVSAYRDAQGFRTEGRKLQVKLIDAYIYHYGWVKSPVQMKRKLKEVGKLWNTDENTQWQDFLNSEDVFNYDEFDSLQRFTDTHPAVMKERIGRQSWNLSLDLSQKKFSFKNKLLYQVEKWTGIRLFDYRNYQLLK